MNILDDVLFLSQLDYGAIIFNAIKWAVCSFIVMLILLLIFKRKVLVRRSHPIRKYIAYSYFLFLPLICLCFGAGYGFIQKTKTEFTNQLPIVLHKGVDAFFEQYPIDITIIVENHQSIEQQIDELQPVLKQKIITALKIKENDNGIVVKIVESTLSSQIGMYYVKENLKTQLANRTKLEKESINKIVTVPINQILTDKTLIDVITIQMNQIMNGFLQKLVILWGIVLLIPLIEIIFANRYHKKWLAVQQ